MYAAVEPENRLVARTLERGWEAALAAEQHLQAEYEQFQACEPVRPNAMEQEAIRRLAEDVPALWRAELVPGNETGGVMRVPLL